MQETRQLMTLSKSRLNHIILALWLCIEFAICELQIIYNADTCSFDWDAYMEQVSHVTRDGGLEFDYSKLTGDTGPLVYPAMHVWIHAALKSVVAWDAEHWTTEVVPKNLPGYEERNIRPVNTILTLQQIYIFLYLVLLYVVGQIYIQEYDLNSAYEAVYVFVLLSLSRRVRETVFLGFFNDTFSVLLTYISIFMFIRKRTFWSCVCFSLAVGVKMNILLYAPGFLAALVTQYNAANAAAYVTVCVVVQLLIAAPFLLVSPGAYLSQAFNLGRKFDHTWSVPFRWLPEEIFSSKLFALLLLAAFVASTAWYLMWRIPAHLPTEKRLVSARVIVKKWMFFLRKYATNSVPSVVPGGFSGTPVELFFVSNFLGVVFARSLHFQFYTWYFHSLPFVLRFAHIPVWLHLPILVLFELAWGNHPPAAWSSALLTVLHLTLAIALCWTVAYPQLSDGIIKKRLKYQV